MNLHTYREQCSGCETEIVYTSNDIGDDYYVECGKCHKRTAPCDLCKTENNGCAECDPALKLAVHKAYRRAQKSAYMISLGAESIDSNTMDEIWKN